MLIGRQAERARMAALLDAARAGRSGSVLVVGEAGIGKTALLGDAASRAEDMRVLRATGVESESALPFAGLHELLAPVLDQLAALASPQAAALRAAFALEPAPGPPDRFAVCAATLSLLATVAEAGAVACLVDDCQWLDPPSADAIRFAARRFDSDPVAIVLAAREGEFDAPGLEILRLGGLDETSATDLIAATSTRDVDADVARQLSRAMGGNPLALLELPAELDEAELAGRAPLSAPLPVSERLTRAFASRIERLPPPTRTLLLLAAASETPDLGTLLAAGRALGAGEGDLGAAEAAGLVTVRDGALRFRHPLVRAVVHASARSAELRSAHLALAGAVEDDERRAWHRGLAAVGPDEQVATLLDGVGRGALARGGAASAARAMERAASLTPAGPERLRRLVAAARAATDAGMAARADALLDEVTDDDPIVRADAALVRADLLEANGERERAYALRLQEATAVETLDPRRASDLVAAAARWDLYRLDTASALRTAERAHDLASRAGPPGPRAVLQLALARMLRGHAADALPLVLACAADQAATADAELAVDVAYALFLCECYDEARALLTATCSRARGGGALRDLARALHQLADLDLRTGHLPAAQRAAAESERIAADIGETGQLALSTFMLAECEAAAGHEPDCRAHVARAAALAPGFAGHGDEANTGLILGLLALSLGRDDAAADRLLPVAQLLDAADVREPGLVQWALDLPEVLARLGRDDEARYWLERLDLLAQETGRIRAAVCVERGRGALAGDDACDAHFERALDLQKAQPNAFEQARTELAHGARLRRARRRRDARPRLRSAVDAFEAMGATAWAERARHELRATGETVRRRDPTVAEQLTPQELGIALEVAEGATNREVGARLFLSPKTVENHLGRIFRKLDLRSRGELIALIARDEGLRGPAG